MGVAERSLRKVSGGIRTLLAHAGLPPALWPMVAKHFCFASNIAIIDGESAWDWRFQKGPSQGLCLPFGCLVDFFPAPKRSKKQQPFAPKAVPGLFLGYLIHARGIYKGE